MVDANSQTIWYRSKIAHLCHLFLFLPLLTVSARAGTLLDFCKSALAKAASQFTYRRTSDHWLNDPQLTASLKAFLDDYLKQIRPGAEKYLGALPPGSLIEVNGVKHEVVSYLGSGYEGTVYLVRGPQGTRVVKKFNGNTSIRLHFKQLGNLAGQGISTVRLFEIDDKNQTALLNYVEGVPVNVLLEERSRDSLSATDRERIRKHYLDFKKRVLPALPAFKDSSVVMDLNTGEFVLIDPV